MSTGDVLQSGTMKPRSLFAALFVASVAAPHSVGQWSSNAAQNLAVANRPNDQAVPKLARTVDGGCWLSWFDHGGANYDVYVQRLDSNGYEQFPHNGLLVSANPQNTSLVDWDLITDSLGNAVLTFTDTRAGGDLDVYAYRISPSGQFLWGANGVALSNDSNFEANPVVAEMTDGSFAFAWSRSVTGADGRLVIQRLDGAGVPQLGAAGIEIFGAAGDDPGFVQIAPSLNGAFILTWIRDTLPATSLKHLHTQKYDAAGAPQWGASALVVYNAASLPIAFKPDILSDGAGGAYYAWHASVGLYFQGRVQHVNAAGTEVFPHNGVEVSLEASRSDFNPSMAPLAGTGDLIVFYNKRNQGQSLWGIGGQRISPTGQLLWGNNGIEFVPLDATTEEVPKAVPCQNGAMCFVEQGNFTTTLLGFRVDAAGTMLWAPTASLISSVVSPKDKLRAVQAADGKAIVAWNDARTDVNDVYAQAVQLDGTLGIPPALVTAYGCGVNPANSLVVVSGAPSLGTTVTFGVDDPGLSMASGSLPVLAIGGAPMPGFPCGLVLGNAGLASVGSNGELLVDLNSLVVPLVSGPAWTNGGGPVPYPVAIPALPAILTLVAELQGALIDPVSGRVGLTNGLQVRIGP